MRAILLILTTVLAMGGIARAEAPGNVTAPIHQFIEGFNVGDAKSAYAAYVAGKITIIDEFPPHLWTGENAVHEWADEYGRHALATGVTDGIVKLGPPTRREIEGEHAYVIMPATYTYKAHGTPTVEQGQMTFVLLEGKPGWKISAWTWSGAAPQAAK